MEFAYPVIMVEPDGVLKPEATGAPDFLPHALSLDREGNDALLDDPNVVVE